MLRWVKDSCHKNGKYIELHSLYKYEKGYSKRHLGNVCEYDNNGDFYAIRIYMIGGIKKSCKPVKYSSLKHAQNHITEDLLL